MAVVTDLPLQPERARSRHLADAAMAIARGLLLAGSVFYLAAYIVLACLRLSYPFELEWMEGGCVDHVRRILAGRPLYVQPTLDFVPLIYPPLYWYASAAASLVLGVGFFPLRLVSFLASLGCFAMLYRFVGRLTQSHFWGIVAAGLYAATYRASGAWFDLARVDSLFMLFLLLAIHNTYFGQRPRQMALAGIWISLAFLTKQPALIIAMPLSLYCMLSKDRWASLAFIATWLVLIGGSILAFNAATHGWFKYYVFTLPQKHHMVPKMLTFFWTNDLGVKPFGPDPHIRNLGLALLVTAYYLCVEAYRVGRKHLLFFGLLTCAMIAESWLSRAHRGGYDNVLQPAFVSLVIGFVLTGDIVQKRWAQWCQKQRDAAALSPQPASNPRSGWRVQPLLLYGLCIAQFAMLHYPLKPQLPTAADRQAGETFLCALKDLHGEVWVPDTGFLPSLAGHRTYAHIMAIHDVLQVDDNPPGERLRREISDTLRSRKFDTIILHGFIPFKAELAKNYRRQKSVFTDDDVFWPVTGMHTRPTWIYVASNSTPRHQAQPPAAAQTQPANEGTSPVAGN